MNGLMMQMPLMISSLIRHADRLHGDTQIVSRSVEGPLHRYAYRDAHNRSRRLARALGRLGVAAGDRIATLAWNGYRHLELYYAVSGIGAIVHTINHARGGARGLAVLRGTARRRERRLRVARIRIAKPGRCVLVARGGPVRRRPHAGSSAVRRRHEDCRRARHALPHDGTSAGNLLVKGPWIASRYYRDDAVPTVDGWFPTGRRVPTDRLAVPGLRAGRELYTIGIYRTQSRFTMDLAKIFMSGRSQAVRLPKQYRFEGDEVLIKRVGDAVVLLPRTRSWDTLFDSLEGFERGFRLERGQPVAQQKRARLK
jgi:virulence-associated protein VagC